MFDRPFLKLQTPLGTDTHAQSDEANLILSYAAQPQDANLAHKSHGSHASHGSHTSHHSSHHR